MADDAEWIRFTSRVIRSSATPRTAAAQYNYILRNDVRQALPLIQAPTLVLHVGENVLVPIAHGSFTNPFSSHSSTISATPAPCVPCVTIFTFCFSTGHED